jgi:hypothetical protein
MAGERDNHGNSPSIAEAFGAVYREHHWGGEDQPFYSGSGSHMPSIVTPYVTAVRAFLARFEHPPQVVDLGCGDFNVGAQIRDQCSTYIACDVVPELIDFNRTRYADRDVDFRAHDLTAAPVPPCDVVFIRQVLQHLSNADIIRGLQNLQGRCRYLVVSEHIPATTDFPANQDKPSGASIRLDFGSGVVLTAPPFNLQPVTAECLCEVAEYDGVVRTIAYGFAEPATDDEPAVAAHVKTNALYALVTHHGSFVTLLPGARQFSHSLPDRDHGSPALFERSGHGWRLTRTLARISDAQREALSAVQVVTELSGDGMPMVVLRYGDGALSAEPARAALVLRPEVSDWERFRACEITTADFSVFQGLRTPRWPAAHQIARRLHQTFRTDRLPEDLQTVSDNLRRDNPDYEYHLWTDAEIPEFIHSHYGESIRDVYLSIHPDYGAARADFFRYLLVYKLGGVYLDIKSTTRIPLANLIRPDDHYLLSQWQDDGDGIEAWWGEHPELYNVPGGEFQQWHVIAAAGHPFLERVINRVLANLATYDPRYAGVGKSAVLRMTGPVAYTLGILPTLADAPHRRFNAQKALAYSAVERHGRFFPRHYSILSEPLLQRPIASSPL